MELSRFLRPSILKFDDWFINVSIGGTGGEDSNIQKDVYFSGKNAYLYASTGSGVTELHIFGNSVQDGTPSIENPVPIISVGENYLQLYSLDINDPSKSGQIIDFGNIKLRSLPNGVCDEIVYKNGQWTHIQRIASIVIDKNTTIQDQLAASNRVTIQINYTLITKPSSNNTNICSKISNSASSVPRFHNYPNTIYVVWDSNKPATFEEAKSLVMDAEFLCELAEPVETILDLPGLQTLNGTTYLLTNDQQVKPYLQGYYDVDTTISGKKIEYIQDGMLSWWQSFGLTNADKPTVIPDKLGNSDLTIKNIGYTNESGFHPTYLQFDGIDDNSNVKIERLIGHIQVTLSDLNDNSNRNLALLSNWAGSNSINITFNRNKLDISKQVADSAKGYINGEEVTSYNIVNGDGSIHTLAISNSKDGYNLHNISISGAFNSANNYFVKERFYEAIAYNRALSNEEVQNNFLVSQIRNGVNIPDDVDPIDIIAERTYASGKKFPIYNTYRDRDNDNIESFKILGYTVQEGTPTPEAPIPLLSVGDEGLKLCISDSETGIALQTINFGDIVLRSVPGGVCDSIEWDGKNWRHVQRVGYVKITPDDIVSVSKIDTSHTNYYVQILGVNKGIIGNDFKYFRANTKYVNHYMCNKFTYAPTADILNTWYLVENSSILSGWVITDKPTKEEFLELIGDGFEFIGELAEPVETILEGIPAPQTSDNETWFGTPPASVKPYMMCECKVKKALKYQGDISAWWYFGGNKSNETDRQIIDISGNGNDLTPYNFAWTRESGWNQGGIHGDGIDDYLIRNEELNIENILIITSEFENNSGGVKYVLGFRSDNNNGGLCLTANNRMGSANSYLTCSPNNILPEPLNYLLLTNNVSNYSSGISLLTFFATDYYYSNGNLHEVILFGNYLTDSEYDNNLKVAKQRNGVDGDINIIPEPEVYYDFSLYNNTDFPTTIENLATDKSKTLQLFNFAGTEESGFFEGALVSDGVDDYAIIQNQTEGFKTVFLDIINLSTNTFIYDQRISSSNSVKTNTFGIFTSPNSIAYDDRNSGLTYVDGVENNTVFSRDLVNKRNVITITNNIVTNINSKIPILFKNALENRYFAKVHIRKFLGFKEALTAEQIQGVINQYFSNENQLTDINGYELTDSEGNYLTVP
jgi:hypothetical protein